MYNHFEWRTLDQQLMKSRYRHTSLAVGDSIVHIGGYNGVQHLDQQPFEIWKMNQETGEFDIYHSSRTLDDWHSYPYVLNFEKLK